MRREFDLTALRSLVAVADAGGVTRAAGVMNLSQSAVSMQIKRLEDVLQCELLDRQGRGVALTAAGEQLLSYARRLLALNDEAFGRLTNSEFEGEVILGVPHDIVYPVIPNVLRQFARDFPKMKVTLHSSFTRGLLEEFQKGQCDIILTTEGHLGEGGETLVELPLVWIGAPGGQAWRQRPLKLAYEQRCIFRQGVQAALDAAGIPWDLAVESDSTRTVEATVSADLAVHTVLAGSEPPYVERIEHGGHLPSLGGMKINLYAAGRRNSPAVAVLAGLIRDGYKARRIESAPLRVAV
ncbi:LysR family transcriptional regulator [Neogemmobacter tilapiae]|uniref:LysR family transcriptional regulator n=1 Tax=Neogemmobacter tilapiae TaxID=875041 RepID=A0A918WJQ0_9RHOB|nr:LysR family transcriptional regulator [Gemmobacter tilapiae]GHC49137.1 LysR family transcriptional regulator [Gemmobacter tilapiae]